MKEKNGFARKLYSLFLIFVLVGLVCFFILNQSNTYERNMQRYAKQIISKIDEFQKKNGRMPDFLSEVTDNEKYNQIFVLKSHGNDQYTLRFLLKNNCHRVYHSEKQIWETDCSR